MYEEKGRKTTKLQSLLVCVHLQKWERRLQRKRVRPRERERETEEEREWVRDLYISRASLRRRDKTEKGRWKGKRQEWGEETETRRSPANAEGTPILGYEATGPSHPAARGEILSAHSKHTKAEETLVYKISIDSPLAVCSVCKQCLDKTQLSPLCFHSVLLHRTCRSTIEAPFLNQSRRPNPKPIQIFPPQTINSACVQSVKVRKR